VLSAIDTKHIQHSRPLSKRTKLEIEQKIQNLINEGIGYSPLRKIPSVCAEAMFNQVKIE
jgi:hypothetical protein